MAEPPEVEYQSVLTANVRQVRISRVYAEALLSLVTPSGQEYAVGAELDSIVKDVLGKNPHIAAFFDSPAVSRRTRGPVLTAALASASPFVRNFVGVLNQNHRLDLFRHIAAAYHGLLDRRSGRIRVKVRSAVPLSGDQQAALRQTLAESLRKEPILELAVDPDLLGGVVVQIGDKVYDSSVKARLAALRTQLITRGTNVAKA